MCEKKFADVAETYADEDVTFGDTSSKVDWNTSMALSLQKGLL